MYASSSPQRFQRAPLPVARARERDRVAVALGDFGEVSERGCGIVEEAQRDPAGGELMLGAVVVLLRDRGVAHDAIGGLGIVEVEQLAGNEPALDPPLVAVDRLRRVGRYRQDQLGGVRRLVGAAQILGAAEHITGVALCLPRHRIEHRLGVGRLRDHGDARLGDGGGVAAARLAERSAPSTSSA